MSYSLQKAELDMTNVLIIAAHPDDEVLGCGGTIAKMSSNGVKVNIAFLADGVSSRNLQSEIDLEELKRRRAASEVACAILGAQPPHFGDLPDNQLDTVSLLSITNEVEKLITSHQPSIILTHHAGDVNIDHQKLNQAVITACRPQMGHPVRTLLFFEVASSTEWQISNSALVFAPNWFEDISHFLDLKIKAMTAYDEELRKWPHPRSLKGIEALARWRGATVGVEAAEAFMLGRELR